MRRWGKYAAVRRRYTARRGATSLPAGDGGDDVEGLLGGGDLVGEGCVGGVVGEVFVEGGDEGFAG